MEIRGPTVNKHTIAFGNGILLIGIIKDASAGNDIKEQIGCKVLASADMWFQCLKTADFLQIKEICPGKV